MGRLGGLGWFWHLMIRPNTRNAAPLFARFLAQYASLSLCEAYRAGLQNMDDVPRGRQKVFKNLWARV